MGWLLLIVSLLSLITQSYCKSIKPSTDQSIKQSAFPVLQHDYVNDLTPYDQLRGTPYKVGFNNRSITITTSKQSIKQSNNLSNNQFDVEYNILVQSGSIHYPRSTPEMWPHLFKLAREAGLNTIQVYFFWNYNVETRYKYDFVTENRNLGQFIQLAGDAGLFVNLRIGPFICGEWTLGGIPQWMKDLHIPFRTNNTVWMNEMQAITQYVVKYTESYQSINGGPIILMQIENEYDIMEGNNAGNKRYVQWAGELTKQVAPAVTWIMCSMHDAPDYIINTCNGLYCDHWIAGKRANFPNQPLLWTENWTGGFVAWGQAQMTRPTQDLMFALAQWIARGGAHHNHYMYHGGTTFGRWTGGPQDTTSYDYDAPLDEYGYPNEPKYSRTSEFHHVINQYAALIVGNPIADAIVVGSNGEIHVYGHCDRSNQQANKKPIDQSIKQSECLIFFTNLDPVNDLPMSVYQLNYTIPAWSVWIVEGSSNQIIYQTNMIDQSIKHSDRKSKKQSIKANPDNILFIEETTGIYSIDRSITLNRPPEMFGYTHDQTDYLWHVQNVTLSNNQLNNQSIYLTLNNVGEFVYVYFGDSRVIRAFGVDVNSQVYRIDVGGSNNQTIYQLKLLVATMGSPNCCGGLEGFTRGIQGKVLIDDVDITHNQWQILSFIQGERESYMSSADAPWASGQHAFTPLTWYKLTIPSPKPVNTELPTWQLDLIGLNKGQIWINGHHMGRYWLLEATQSTCNPDCNWRGSFNNDKCRYGCGEPTQRLYHVPRSWLKPIGEMNVIVALEEIGGDPATITLLQRN